jgi:hypothetical protein
MKYIIQVKAKKEIRYLQDLHYWLFEEFKQNATTFETIEQATKRIGELLADWLWETYTILEEETYYPIKEISISDYK